MTTLTFEQIEARTAAFHAGHNSPAAVAVRAIEQLRDALERVTDAERAEIVELLRDELPPTF